MGAWLTAAPSRQPLYHSMSPVEAALQQTLDLRTFARRLCGQHCPPSGTPSGPRNLAFSLSPRVLSQSYAGPQYPGFCSHRVTPCRQHAAGRQHVRRVERAAGAHRPIRFKTRVMHVSCAVSAVALSLVRSAVWTGGGCVLGTVRLCNCVDCRLSYRLSVCCVTSGWVHAFAVFNIYYTCYFRCLIYILEV
jgi:hypothetical protein